MWRVWRHYDQLRKEQDVRCLKPNAPEFTENVKDCCVNCVPGKTSPELRRSAEYQTGLRVIERLAAAGQGFAHYQIEKNFPRGASEADVLTLLQP